MSAHPCILRYKCETTKDFILSHWKIKCNVNEYVISCYKILKSEIIRYFLYSKYHSLFLICQNTLNYILDWNLVNVWILFCSHTSTLLSTRIDWALRRASQMCRYVVHASQVQEVHSRYHNAFVTQPICDLKGIILIYCNNQGMLVFLIQFRPIYPYTDSSSQLQH